MKLWIKVLKDFLLVVFLTVSSSPRSQTSCVKPVLDPCSSVWESPQPRRPKGGSGVSPAPSDGRMDTGLFVLQTFPGHRDVPTRSRKITGCTRTPHYNRTTFTWLSDTTLNYDPWILTEGCKQLQTSSTQTHRDISTFKTKRFKIKFNETVKQVSDLKQQDWTTTWVFQRSCGCLLK